MDTQMSGPQQWALILLYGGIVVLYTFVGRFSLRRVARRAALQLGQDSERVANEITSAWMFSGNYWLMLAPVLCLIAAVRK